MFPEAVSDLAAKQQPDASTDFLFEVKDKIGVLKAVAATFSDTWTPDADSGSLLAITAAVKGVQTIRPASYSAPYAHVVPHAHVPRQPYILALSLFFFF